MKHLLLVIVAVIALSGCNSDDGNRDELRRYIEETKARAPGPIQPLPEFKEPKTFLYLAGGRRSPFQPEVIEKAAPLIVEQDYGPKPDPTRAPEELESYELDSLRMVGTLKVDGAQWGLVLTKDGTIHRVSEGNYMGKNYGRIVAITETEITLIELVQTASGNYIERDASVEMYAR
jgi:type IV pilus assembly protein PilP